MRQQNYNNFTMHFSDESQQILIFLDGTRFAVQQEMFEANWLFSVLFHWLLEQ